LRSVPIHHEAARGVTAMTIEFACVCGTRYSVPEKAQGRKSTCRKCGRPISVPWLEEPITDIEVIPDKPKVSAGAVRAIVWSVFGLFLVLLIWFWQYQKGKVDRELNGMERDATRLLK
jgi:hypothetical protein